MLTGDYYRDDYRRDASIVHSLRVTVFASRGVAQPGSAPVWGTGGHRFESCHPDHVSVSLFLAEPMR